MTRLLQWDTLWHPLQQQSTKVPLPWHVLLATREQHRLSLVRLMDSGLVPLAVQSLVSNILSTICLNLNFGIEPKINVKSAVVGIPMLKNI